MEYEKLYPFWEHLTESEKEYIENSCYKKKYEKGKRTSCDRHGKEKERSIVEGGEMDHHSLSDQFCAFGCVWCD